jgi:hypothetical protein
MREFLSLSALARALGRDKSGLGRHAKKGTIPRRSDGKFDLEAVRRALKQNVDLAMARPARRRVASLQSTHSLRSTRQQLSTPIDEREPVTGLDIERVLVDGKFMTIDNAQALAETYRARLAKLQYDSASGALRKAEDERWMAWAPRAATVIAEELAIDRQRLVAALEDQVARETIDVRAEGSAALAAQHCQ